jgi:O-antigen/teichoic acid export membrane protein
MVRYLSTTDYGALAYGLALAGSLHIFLDLGLRETTTRFVSIYHEKHEYAKLFGAILLAIGTILLIAAGLILGFFLLPASVTRQLVNDSNSLYLLSVLIFLAPVEALDELFMGLLASFARPRSIFFRRHVLGPGLKLCVVLLMLVWQRDVLFLAYGYLAASVFGVLTYVWLLVRLLHRQGLFQHCRLATLQVPVQETFAFALTLYGSHLLTMAMNSANVFILGYFHDTTEVAFFRVVLPAAHLNIMVMRNFGLLFLPMAARAFATGKHDEVRQLYVQTAGWMALVTFPIFATTFALAQPLTTLLYGARYESSGVILAWLALGYYFRVVLGFNELTLKALGKLRSIITIDATAALITVAVNVVLISRYGALGAAISTAGSMIIHNILRQVGLQWALEFSIFDRQYVSFYLIFAAGVLSLFGIQFLNGNSFVAVPLAVLVTVVMFVLTQKKLQVAETFPEVRKLPLLGRLFV